MYKDENPEFQYKKEKLSQNKCIHISECIYISEYIYLFCNRITDFCGR